MPAFAWKVPTLVGLIRVSAEKLFGYFSLLPLVLIPGLAMIIESSILLKRPRALVWKDFFPAAMLCSYLVSPYGWVADQALLLLIPVYVIAEAFSMSRKHIMLIFFSGAVLNALAYYLTKHVHHEEHELIWFPIGLGIFYLSSLYLAKKDALLAES